MIVNYLQQHNFVMPEEFIKLVSGSAGVLGGNLKNVNGYTARIRIHMDFYTRY